MIFWVLLLISVAVGLGCAALAGFAFWRTLVMLAAAYVAVNLIYILLCCMGAFGVDKSKKIEKQSELCRKGAVRVARFVDAYLRIRVSVTGKEKLPEDGRFLFVCNHRSMADPIIVIDKLSEYNISFICKPSLEKLPLIWQLGHGAGFLSINRDNDREALKTIITAAGFIKKDMCSIGIYPEGTRSKTAEMLPFRAGAFKIAQKADCPLVIASVCGTERIHINYPLRRTEVRLNIIEVLSAETVSSMSTAELSEHSRELIRKSLEEAGK